MIFVRLAKNFNRTRITTKVFLCLASCFALASCGAKQPAEIATPDADAAALAPIVLSIPADREAQAAQAFDALLRTQGIINESVSASTTSSTAPTLSTAPRLTLQPRTRTVAALPALPVPLTLPRVVALEGANVTAEEAEREALRRFITANASLFGAEKSQLSLISIKDVSPSTRRAEYEQKLFPLPLRGGYGVVQVDYTKDNRITGLSSTALPTDAETSKQLTDVARRLISREQAREGIARLLGRPSETFEPQQVVIFPQPISDAAPTLALRLLWEIKSGDETFFLDAFKGQELVKP